MSNDHRRTRLIEAVDAAIAAFDQDGRLSRERATKRAARVTGFDWTFSALLILQGMNENGKLRMTELAGLVGTTPPTVTKLIKDLKDRGLVDRTPDEQDGRASYVSLTEEGRRVAKTIGQARVDALTQVLDGWNEDDLERCATLFERLRTDMRRLS